MCIASADALHHVCDVQQVCPFVSMSVPVLELRIELTFDECALAQRRR